MRPGEEIISGVKNLDNEFFLGLKHKQCGSNPNLASFMSEEILKIEADEKTKKRLLQVSLFALEILGAGDVNNSDYVRVSKESLEAARRQETVFSIDTIYAKNPAFADAVTEARYYVKNLNDLFNDFYKTKIFSAELWQKMEIFLKAYWIETQKQKPHS